MTHTVREANGQKWVEAEMCFCRLDPSSSSFHQGLQMWPKVDAEYSLHAFQRSWPRVLCSLMCCMLVLLLLWPKSLC